MPNKPLSSEERVIRDEIRRGSVSEEPGFLLRVWFSNWNLILSWDRIIHVTGKQIFKPTHTLIRERHTGNCHVPSISRYLCYCKILMIIDLTLRHDPGIDIPQSSESRKHIALRCRECLSLYYQQDPKPNTKGSAEIRILVDPSRGVLSKKPGSETASITGSVRIFYKNTLWEK